MSEFGGKMDGKIIPEKQIPDKNCKPETDQDYAELFKDDFDGIKTSGPDHSNEKIDTEEAFKELFADDYKDADNCGKSADTEDKQMQEDDGKREKEQCDKSDKEDIYEYDEDGTRELTDDVKQKLKDILGWSDKKINENCRIDKAGTIHYKTDCQDKEGTTADCGVSYERKTIEYKGIKIEGVFPVFDSAFDTELDAADYLKSNGKQFGECNKELKKAIENDPELREQFTDEQLEDIEDEKTPRGYSWHHSEEPGKMQLVKTEDHDKTIGGAAHTGGNSIWGNKSVDKSDDSIQKGVQF